MTPWTPERTAVFIQDQHDQFQRDVQAGKWDRFGYTTAERAAKEARSPRRQMDLFREAA